MSACVAAVPGCEDCATYPLRPHPHECDDLCRLDAEFAADPEYHRLRHEPVRCEGCRAVLDDRKGTDRMVQRLCPEGCCRQWCCPDCGAEWASDGPVGCPACSPISWFGRGVAAGYRLWRRLLPARQR